MQPTQSMQPAAMPMTAAFGHLVTAEVAVTAAPTDQTAAAGGLNILTDLGAMGPAPEQQLTNAQPAPISADRRSALRRLINGIRRR